MQRNPYAVPVAEAEVSERVAFLRRVGLLTLGGLAIAGISSGVGMAAVLFVPFLQGSMVSLAVMLGGIFGARFVGSSLVNSDDQTTQMAGFVAGSALQGVAMSYLMLSAVMLSAALYANPMVFLFQALGLVGLTVVGMVAYLLSGPRQLSMVGGALSALTLPMLALMAFSWVFPMGGIFGILISLVFVGVSAGGLLFNLNQVMHQMSTERSIPAAYHITLGILVLFWNVLSLLMRLQSRD